jgi:hypothetical protein
VRGSTLIGVTDLLPFGDRLGRLLEHRATPASALAEAAGVPSADLGHVLAGADPSDELLRRLAPALGLHTADLFLFATRTVPDDLAPAQLDGPWHLDSALHWHIGPLSQSAHARLRQFVDELPVRPTGRTRPFPSDGHEDTPGRIIWRLLANRNIRMSKYAPMLLGGGPYMSDSTYRMVCGGRLPLTDEYVNAFARAIGLAPRDLGALLGLDVAELPWSISFPWPADLVDLVWSARRLDSAQVQALCDYADTLR